MQFQMNDINCDFLTFRTTVTGACLYISHPSLLIKQDTSLKIFAESSLFVCIFVASFPSLEFFTHIETTSSPVQGCEFWPMLGTYDHWAVRTFSVPHVLWHGASVYYGHLREPVTFTPNAKRLDKGAVTTCFDDLVLSRLGFAHSAFCMRGKQSYRQRHCIGYLHLFQHSSAILL